MQKLFDLGRVLLAGGIVAMGVRQLATGTFVRLVPVSPAESIAASPWAILSGGILAVSGVLLLLRQRRLNLVGGAAAGGLLGLLFIALYIPQLAANPGAGYVWTNPLKTLALIAGVALAAGVAAPAAPHSSSRRFLSVAWVLSWVFVSAFLLTCGIQHFHYAAFVDALVPAWIPLSPRFWTLFCGAALVAGGIGSAVPTTRRLAAMLSGVMILLWVLLLHLPRTMEMKSLFEFDGALEAIALSGVAFLLCAAHEMRGKARSV